METEQPVPLRQFLVVDKIACEEAMKNSASPSPDPSYDLWKLLAHTRHAMSKARQKELRQYHIFGRRTAVLAAIGDLGDKATPGAIARWLFREPHSVSEFLSRMEKEGLVTKVRDFARKNQIRVVMTEKGHEVHLQSVKRESIHNIMSVLSEEEYQQLRLYLQKLWNKALEELRIDHESFFSP